MVGKKTKIKTDAEKKELKAFIEDYNKANNLPIDITDSINHEDFVVGFRSNKMGIKILKGVEYTLLSGWRKTIFNILVILYMVAPIIIVPLWAYHQSDWWLLLGIAFSYTFTFFAIYTTATIPIRFRWLKNIIIFFTLFSIGYWFKNSFHIQDYLTFFYFCSLWGSALFQMAESTQKHYAKQALVKNSDLFYTAIAEEKITIIKVREETNK